MVARGEPIIGGGAGTGLSAKCEEAGGIDLIVIYNSGPLPDGGTRLARRPARLRQRERDRGRDGARGAAGRAATRRCSPASTAPTRSCCATTSCAGSASSASPASRTFPPSASSTACSAPTSRKPAWATAHEVELIRAARALDLLTTPYVFCEDERARDGRGRRRHHRLPSRPHHRRRDRRRHGADARRLRAAHRRVVGGGARGRIPT